MIDDRTFSLYTLTGKRCYELRDLRRAMFLFTCSLYRNGGDMGMGMGWAPQQQQHFPQQPQSYNHEPHNSSIHSSPRTPAPPAGLPHGYSEASAGLPSASPFPQARTSSRKGRRCKVRDRKRGKVRSGGNRDGIMRGEQGLLRASRFGESITRRASEANNLDFFAGSDDNGLRMVDYLEAECFEEPSGRRKKSQGNGKGKGGRGGGEGRGEGKKEKSLPGQAQDGGDGQETSRELDSSTLVTVGAQASAPLVLI